MSNTWQGFASMWIEVGIQYASDCGYEPVNVEVVADEPGQMPTMLIHWRLRTELCPSNG